MGLHSSVLRGSTATSAELCRHEGAEGAYLETQSISLGVFQSEEILPYQLSSQKKNIRNCIIKGLFKITCFDMVHTSLTLMQL